MKKNKDKDKYETCAESYITLLKEHLEDLKEKEDSFIAVAKIECDIAYEKQRMKDIVSHRKSLQLNLIVSTLFIAVWITYITVKLFIS